jgi:hypothetical protein
VVQSKDFEQSLCDHNVRNFIVSADIVNVTWLTFVPVEYEKDKNYGSAVSINRCSSANCRDNTLFFSLFAFGQGCTYKMVSKAVATSST